MSQESEPITVIDEIATSTTEEYRYKFPSDATLTQINVSTYVGHEFDLQYTFEVAREGEGQTYNLLRPLGKDFIAGNGEEFELPIRVEVERDDELIVTVENEDSSNLYHSNARIGVDYGLKGTITAMLKEVFN